MLRAAAGRVSATFHGGVHPGALLRSLVAMPAPGEVLRQHASIASRTKPFAGAEHALLLALLLGVAGGWRPSRRTAAVALALPSLSVAVVALGYGNPFDATSFTVLAAALLVLGLRLPPAPIGTGSPIASLLGAGVAASGWAYQGFLTAEWRLEHLVTAPIGLLPVPTLALAVGLSIVGSGFGSRAWALVLGAAAGFYGLEGALRLGMASDLVLLAGALVLIGRSWRAVTAARERSSADLPGRDAASRPSLTRAGPGVGPGR